MKRPGTLWRGMVFFLILLTMVGFYGLLALLLRLQAATPAGSLGSRPADVLPSSSPVQILEPAGGSATQQGTVLDVRAAVRESGFVQAELEVDGQSAGACVNPDPQYPPWFAEWEWGGAEVGSHTLVVRAWDGQSEWMVSEPLTLTVVPKGRLLFASNRDGAYALYSMGTDGQGLERLTEGTGGAQQPAPGPAGWLAYVAEGAGGEAVIRWRNPDGQEMDLAAGREPDWFRLPAGQAVPAGVTGPSWLAYSASPNGLSQVYVQYKPGGIAIPITGEAVYAGQPSWLPSEGGAIWRLAYVAEREQNWDVWLTSVGGGQGMSTGPQRLTDDLAMDWAPACSPDGTRVAFVSDRAGSHQVYVMHADGSEVRAVTELGQGAESPAWSPDGSWLAMVAYTGEGTGIDRREIYLVRADGQALVRLTHNAFDDTDVAWSWEP